MAKMAWYFTNKAQKYLYRKQLYFYYTNFKQVAVGFFHLLPVTAKFTLLAFYND